MSIAIFTFMIFQISVLYSTDTSFDEAQNLLNVPVFEINELNNTPNVYLLMLDAYSGQITLENFFKWKFRKHIIRTNRNFYSRKIGYVVSPNNLELIPGIIENIDDKNPLNEQIKKIRSETVFNMGRSAIVGSDVIEKIYNDLK